MKFDRVGPRRPSALEQLVLPHVDAAFHLARWLLRKREDAEDVAQEARSRRPFVERSAWPLFGTHTRKYLPPAPRIAGAARVDHPPRLDPTLEDLLWAHAPVISDPWTEYQPIGSLGDQVPLGARTGNAGS